MSCTRSYGKSIIEFLIHTEDLEGRKILKTNKNTVIANSSIPFHYSIPLIPDSLYMYSMCLFKILKVSALISHGHTVSWKTD